MAKWKRFVVGPDANGKSAVLMHDATNVQEDPGIFYRATLWSTAEVPVDHTITKDRSLDITPANPVPAQNSELAKKNRDFCVGAIPSWA